MGRRKGIRVVGATLSAVLFAFFLTALTFGLALGDEGSCVAFVPSYVVAASGGGLVDAPFGCVRAAHRCNSRERLDECSLAWAVEVDVREMTSGGDIAIWHEGDERSDLLLSEVLDVCQERGQVAILDTIHGTDLGTVVRMVAERDMFSQVRFQVSDLGDAYELCGRDPRCLVWLLNGTGSDGETLRLADVQAASEVLCGVNVCGKLVGRSVSLESLSALCVMSGRGASPLEVCVFAYGQRGDVYGLDGTLADIGVSVLMTDAVG